MILLADFQKRPVPRRRIRRLAGLVLRREGRTGDLSIAFVGARKMLALNRKFLRHDFPTDVLAFPTEGRLLGEVVVSTDYAAREARERGIPYEEELLRYVAHGTLHLLGYDDHSPGRKREMWRRQEAYLAEVL